MLVHPCYSILASWTCTTESGWQALLYIAPLQVDMEEVMNRQIVMDTRCSTKYWSEMVTQVKCENLLCRQTFTFSGTPSSKRKDGSRTHDQNKPKRKFRRVTLLTLFIFLVCIVFRQCYHRLLDTICLCTHRILKGECLIWEVVLR